MRRLWILLGLVVLSARVSRAEILTLWADSGVSSTTVGSYITYEEPGFSSDAVFLGTATDIAPPEGYSSWKTSYSVTRPSSWIGWGLTYNTPQDLSRFDNGELRFWVYTNVDLKVEVQDSGGDRISVMISSYGWSTQTTNQWVLIRLPIAPLMANDLAKGGTGELNDITSPFLFTALSGPSVFYIDDVRYVDSTSMPIFDVGLFNSGSNTPATTIDWGNVSLSSPVGWTMASQYLKFDVDTNTYPWGVQIYTDNTATDASPKFQSPVPAGQPGSNPAGLVEEAAPGTTIPLAWAVKVDSSATPPIAADPNNISSDVNAYQWFYMEDAATPAIAASSTTVFQNGDPYITVKNNVGIHFAQGVGVGPATFGAQNPPNVVYFETNLGNAISPNTYKTTTLRVEFYYP